MDGRERALALIGSFGDPALYEPVRQALVRGAGEVAMQLEDGVLVVNRRCGVHLIAARTQEAAWRLCGGIPASAGNIALHGADRDTAQAIRARFGLANALEFVLYAYYGGFPEAAEDVCIRTLNAQDVGFLAAHYSHAGRAYLAERVQEGVMLGAITDGALAGFIGEHNDGAMGLLHILPQYRRRGLALALEREAIRRRMRAGGVPFAQVAPDNAASHALQARLGFTRAQGMCIWLTDDDF